MPRQNSYRDVLAIREFRALWSAEIISVCGDQLARVALSLLVFQQTSSAGLTALTYALTFVPALLGGMALSGLADRFPRRRVLLISDLTRAGFAGLMALPALPLPALWALVFGLALAGAPFKAAQLALLRDVLDGDLYPAGLATRTVSTQLAQLGGFVGGGAVLLALPAPAALGANALTFVMSALIVRAGVRPRPAALSSASRTEPPISALALLATNKRLLVLLGFTGLAGLTVAPEGVAVPYADGLGGAALAVGVLLAADPLGSALGAGLSGLTRSPRSRGTAIAPLAVTSGLALLLCSWRPGLVPSAVLWVTCGACSTTTLLIAQTMLVDAVPNARRGAITGLASAGLQSAQGLAVVAAGALGEQVGVYRAVGAIGAVTALIAALLGLAWRRARPPSATAEQAGHDVGHRLSVARSEVTVTHSAPPFPDRSDSNKVGNV